MATHASFQISALGAVVSVVRQYLDTTEAVQQCNDDGRAVPDLDKMARRQRAQLTRLVAIVGRATDEDDETGIVALRKQLSKEGFPS